jgi:hypothetical protein
MVWVSNLTAGTCLGRTFLEVPATWTGMWTEEKNKQAGGAIISVKCLAGKRLDMLESLLALLTSADKIFWHFIFVDTICFQRIKFALSGPFLLIGVFRNFLKKSFLAFILLTSSSCQKTSASHYVMMSWMPLMTGFFGNDPLIVMMMSSVIHLVTVVSSARILIIPLAPRTPVSFQGMSIQDNFDPSFEVSKCSN